MKVLNLLLSFLIGYLVIFKSGAPPWAFSPFVLIFFCCLQIDTKPDKLLHIREAASRDLKKQEGGLR